MSEETIAILEAVDRVREAHVASQAAELAYKNALQALYSAEDHQRRVNSEEWAAREALLLAIIGAEPAVVDALGVEQAEHLKTLWALENTGLRSVLKNTLREV